MQKIYFLSHLLLCSLCVCAQEFSVVGCTYESQGLQHYVISFISSSECVISQTDRLSSCSRVDTLLYHFGEEGGIYIEPHLTTDSQAAPTFSYGNCWLNPYVYVDGEPLKMYPIAKQWKHEGYSYFVERNLGVFIDLSQRQFIRFFSPSFLRCLTTQKSILFRLTSGIPSIDADSIRSLMTDIEKEAFAQMPSSFFGDCWYSRTPYTPRRHVSLAGKCFESSSKIKESWFFLDDSLCSYIQSIKKPYCRVEQFCHYSICENGKVVITADSIHREGEILKKHFGYRYYWQHPNCIEAENIVTSDTLLMCGDFLLYSKVYAAEDCYYTRVMPLHVYERVLLLNKAYVRKGRVVSRSKIGRSYQKYLTPVNYNR